MPDTTRLCDGPCGAGSTSGRATGAPPLLTDPGAADSLRYAVFGAESWATLTANAQIVLPPGAVVAPAPVVAGAVCDRAAAGNWGDPGSTAACSDYAPIIWARGDVEVSGGTGQGILLAEGDVTVSGGTLFAGLVITRDDLRSSLAGGTILGAVLAGDRVAGTGDHSHLGDHTLVQRSSCAVARAVEHSARLIPVNTRSWTPLR